MTRSTPHSRKVAARPGAWWSRATPWTPWPSVFAKAWARDASRPATSRAMWWRVAASPASARQMRAPKLPYPPRTSVLSVAMGSESGGWRDGGRECWKRCGTRRAQQGLQRCALGLHVGVVPVGYVGCWNWFAEHVALDAVQPNGGQRLQLLHGLHAFHHHRQAELAGQRADMPQQHLPPAVLRQLSHKEPVAFDACNRQVGQHAQRRVAGAKVVHPHHNTHGAECVDGGHHLRAQRNDGVFGHFEFEGARRQAAQGQFLTQPRGKAVVQQRDGGHVHADENRRWAESAAPGFPGAEAGANGPQ